MTDTILEDKVIRHLISNFGIIETERFISIIIKDQFDYTKWQSDLFDDISVSELFKEASEWKNGN